MKKIISLILSLVMILSFTACGTKAEATWQEQYDLGVKYVNEAKYEEAILAFTKALEIDPKQAPVYIALAEVYVRQENYIAAQETLDKAIAEIGVTEELAVAKDKITRKEQGIPYIAKTKRLDYDDGGYTIYEYDEKGNLVYETVYNPDDSIRWRYVTLEYNSDDLATVILCYNSENNIEYYSFPEYSENGRQIMDQRYDAYGTTYGRAANNDNGYWTYYGGVFSAINNNPEMPEYIEYDFYNDGVIDCYGTYEYDSTNHLTRFKFYNSNDMLEYVSEYSADTDSYYATWYNPDGSVKRTFEFV